MMKNIFTVLSATFRPIAVQGGWPEMRTKDGTSPSVALGIKLTLPIKFADTINIIEFVLIKICCGVLVNVFYYASYDITCWIYLTVPP